MKIKFYIVMLACLCAGTSAFAQSSRSIIKRQIDEWGSCRNVTVTLTGGDLALNGKNACVCPNVPVELALELAKLQEKDAYIDDVQLTEKGVWLILYDDNGFVWDELPPDLESKLAEYNRDGDIVTSVAFNDKGDWILISTEHFNTSSPDLDSWISEGIEMYGQLWTAHMTDDGIILCFENGYRLQGNVPDTLRQKLREVDIDVYRVKFLSDGTYFIADQDGQYAYYM